MSSLTIILVILAVVVLAAIWIYNNLVRSKVRVNEAWSDINVQLKRRLDLIPNLVNAVKGYAKHEQSVFEKVTEARAQALTAQSVKDTAKADNMLTGALKSIFAVAEAYPDLKASANFMELQDELTDTENKIQAARRFYNGAVRDFNTKIAVFPTNVFAGMLGFKGREFYEVEEGEQAKADKPVDVDFNQ